MAELAVERLAAAQLVLDLAAVAVGCVLDIEAIDILVVYAVGRTLLPLGDASRRLAAALVLVHSECCLGEFVVGMVSRDVRGKQLGTR